MGIIFILGMIIAIIVIALILDRNIDPDKKHYIILHLTDEELATLERSLKSNTLLKDVKNVDYLIREVYYQTYDEHGHD